MILLYLWFSLVCIKEKQSKRTEYNLRQPYCTTAVKIINSAMQTSILNTSSLLKALAYISIQGVHIPLKVTASGGEEEDSRGAATPSPLTSHSIVSSCLVLDVSLERDTFLALSVCLSVHSTNKHQKEGVMRIRRIRRVERWFQMTLQSSAINLTKCVTREY